MFSRSCEYALQSILYITLHSKNGKAVGLKQISDSQKIPLHFLSKILQQLVKGKVLNSIKGPNGGFALNVSPNRLRLIKVVELIDGLDIFDRCGIGLKKCSDKTPCPIHFDFKVVKEKIRQVLTEKTLSELCDDVDKGLSIVSFR
ncbi:MAG: Rrf2 family transcriptional regulator [Bacteroidetes bacterium]|nr:MAG: Rrf2 family transcriptional regulator [Bacteroidota bacterium]